MNDFRNSEKYQAALVELPEELHGIYEQMVEQYSWHTMRLYGRGYVAYEVLASMVRDGWRASPEPLRE